MTNNHSSKFSLGRLLAVSIVGTVALVGCAFDGSLLYRESFQERYDHDQLMAFNGDKQMRLDVYGNPFEENADTVATAVSKAMYGHNDGLPIEFTASPSPETFEHNRVVVLFQPPPSAIGRTVCDGSTLASADPGAGGNSNVEALIAFCWRGAERSSLRIRMGDISSLQDPSFDTMFSRATNRLMPYKNPFSGSETCRPNC